MSGIHGKVSRSPVPGFAVSDYHYDLPESLIAQHPTAKRGSSRLLEARLDELDEPRS